MEKDKLELYIQNGDVHGSSSRTLPVRQDAFDLSDEAKIAIIAENFKNILLTLGLDLSDDSIEGTPHRVAKMYVQEIFSGINPANKPSITLFENKFNYGEMLVEKKITVQTVCEHHFVPIIGVAHVGYISSGKVIGLSKINRIVKYHCKRPQIQERLTVDIAAHLAEALDTPDVAVIIDAKHFCVSMRGVEDVHSSTVTASYLGKFGDPHVRENFLHYIADVRPY